MISRSKGFRPSLGRSGGATMRSPHAPRRGWGIPHLICGGMGFLLWPMCLCMHLSMCRFADAWAPGAVGGDRFRLSLVSRGIAGISISRGGRGWCGSGNLGKIHILGKRRGSAISSPRRLISACLTGEGEEAIPHIELGKAPESLWGQVAALRHGVFAVSDAEDGGERGQYLALLDRISKGAECLVATTPGASGVVPEGTEPIEIQNLRELLAFGWVTEAEFEKQRQKALREHAEGGTEWGVVGAVDVNAIVPEEGEEDDGVGGLVYLSNMAVLESYRRRGIGSELLKLAEEGSARIGIGTAVLHVAEVNDAGMSLYVGAGYERIPEKRVATAIIRRISHLLDDTSTGDGVVLMFKTILHKDADD